MRCDSRPRDPGAPVPAYDADRGTIVELAPDDVVISQLPGKPGVWRPMDASVIQRGAWFHWPGDPERRGRVIG